MNSPIGKLIAIGGAEDKGTESEGFYTQHHNLHFFELGILRRVVQEVGGVDRRIEVITTASSIPKEVGENYLGAFGKIGCENVGILNIRNREEAKDEQNLLRIRSASCVMISGGDQLRLSSIFGGTDFLQIILDRYIYDGLVIAGTSAGAMAMSNTMIYQGKSELAHLKGEVKITTGLAFVGNVIIDSHFDKRGRFNRLAQAVASNPSCTGIGLGEDTGVIITGGNHLEVIGSGAVVIVDGRDIKHSNITDVSMGTPICVENIKVSILVQGNSYMVKERQFIAGGAIQGESSTNYTSISIPSQER
ncbi:MAG: cyanophycinase [Flavobacteriales bacterium]|nr:cyanophycinase [Flavobacteriales bacterium]